MVYGCCFFFKQKTAYEMRISDWSSDVCSSDLDPGAADQHQLHQKDEADQGAERQVLQGALAQAHEVDVQHHDHEEEQHGDRPDVDEHQDHGEELRAHQHEEAGGVEIGRAPV